MLLGLLRHQRPKKIAARPQSVEGIRGIVAAIGFFCVLKDIDRVRLQTDLEEQMNQKEDQAMILDLGPNEKEAREAATVIGQPLPKQDSGIVVV